MIALKLMVKNENATLKNYENKIKSKVMIYADFEGILVPQDNLGAKSKFMVIN